MAFFNGGIPGVTTPMTVAGNLPWGQGANPLSAGSPSELANSYASAYNASLQQNKANYNNVLAGYQNALTAQQQAAQAVQGGYSSLYADVQNKIGGIGQARNQEILDQARAQSGAASQSLINRGLGNTTVANSVERGIQYDRSKALNQNAEGIAGLQAGYMSGIGQAGLGQAERNKDAQTSLVGRQLDWMNSVSAGYPDPGLYANLASRMGGGGFSGGGGMAPANYGSPGLGYSPHAFAGDTGGSGVAPSYGGGYGGLGALSAYGAAPAGGGWNTPSAAYAQPEEAQGNPWLGFAVGQAAQAYGGELSGGGGDF